MHTRRRSVFGPRLFVTSPTISSAVCIGRYSPNFLSASSSGGDARSTSTRLAAFAHGGGRSTSTPLAASAHGCDRSTTTYLMASARDGDHPTSIWRPPYMVIVDLRRLCWWLSHATLHRLATLRRLCTRFPRAVVSALRRQMSLPRPLPPCLCLRMRLRSCETCLLLGILHRWVL